MDFVVALYEVMGERGAALMHVLSSSAAVLGVFTFAFLDGTIRWLVLGLAVIEVVLVPRFLKQDA